ncbi:hypothetical protein BpHYR1_008325 [Brachionus plicatilis]|uniref:Uncharacterized protein n=1 Tax=Brachionus plicatilis TaxID=10195 RepID=A0A3M7QI12_BRAPC|nr:hypothetical protein BpHYR1_008325 [Brachionus plicatilis]
MNWFTKKLKNVLFTIIRSINIDYYPYFECVYLWNETIWKKNKLIFLTHKNSFLSVREAAKIATWNSKKSYYCDPDRWIAVSAKMIYDYKEQYTVSIEILPLYNLLKKKVSK